MYLTTVNAVADVDRMADSPSAAANMWADFQARAGLCGEQRQAVTPQHAVQVENAAQHDERERLVRRIGVDKLRHEGEEENRHFRIQHIGQETLREDFPVRQRRDR